jgi:uncharacterized protein (TIGR00251 family)
VAVAESRPLRFAVHVSPGARRERVGGNRGGSLVVKVRAPAVEGAATEAALRLVAEAFAVRPSAVTCERGARQREKTIAIEGEPDALRARLAELLEL